MNGDSTLEVAVGLDMGSWNARVATFDESLNHPVVAHNQDGNRITRAQLLVTNEDGPEEFVSVLKAMQECDDADGGDDTTSTPKPQVTEFVQGILQLACDSTHKSMSQLRVVTSVAADDSCSPKGKNCKEPLQACLDELKTLSVGFILEPAAICLAYEPDPATVSNVLVIDGGASGLKVSIVKQIQLSSDKSQPPLFSIVEHRRHETVSAPLLLEQLGMHVADQFGTKCRFPKGEVYASKKVKKKLERHCESALTTLFTTGQSNATIHIDGLYEGMDCQVTISKPRWEMVAAKMASRVKDILKQVSAERNIDIVLLSGTLHAWLRPLVESVFSAEKVARPTFDPCEAVALGCAKQAYWNIQQTDELLKTTTLEVVQEIPLSPVSIAVLAETAANDESETKTDASGEELLLLIQVGTPLPAVATHQPAADATPFALWQIEPTRKKLAVFDTSSSASSASSSSSLLRVQLSETGRLSIHVGGEHLTIG
jgi:hypothetical protein